MKRLFELYKLFMYLEEDIIAIQNKLGIEGNAIRASRSINSSSESNLTDTLLPEELSLRLKKVHGCIDDDPKLKNDLLELVFGLNESQLYERMDERLDDLLRY